MVRFKENLIGQSGLIFCLIFGILAFSGTSKIPNFALMGAYQLPNFPDITTGMSILRIWTIVEKFEYSHFGELYFSNNFVYGLFAGYLIYLICNRAIKNNNFSKQKERPQGRSFFVASYYVTSSSRFPSHQPSEQCRFLPR